jgi:hypothetical protein
MGSDNRNHLIYLQVISKNGRFDALKRAFLPLKVRTRIESRGLALAPAISFIFYGKNAGFKLISGLNQLLNNCKKSYSCGPTPT